MSETRGGDFFTFWTMLLFIVSIGAQWFVFKLQHERQLSSWVVCSLVMALLFAQAFILRSLFKRLCARNEGYRYLLMGCLSLGACLAIALINLT